LPGLGGVRVSEPPEENWPQTPCAQPFGEDAGETQNTIRRREGGRKTRADLSPFAWINRVGGGSSSRKNQKVKYRTGVKSRKGTSYLGERGSRDGVAMKGGRIRKKICQQNFICSHNVNKKKEKVEKHIGKHHVHHTREERGTGGVI